MRVRELQVSKKEPSVQDFREKIQMANMIDKQQRNAHVLKAYDIANPGSLYIPSGMGRESSRLDED